ncbi:alpha beta hydrolase protein [Purpureocillium lavendulum]|uniref:Alpha beta hydrolase protein n=1 Tax=Purpureocillium lavendulum TaxID=1247861 RepID=A0AB34FMB4_9HYPO|nr:alpha beta hydrolase protein [Purpureocillium lavendulum]
MSANAISRSGPAAVSRSVSNRLVRRPHRVVGLRGNQSSLTLPPLQPLSQPTLPSLSRLPITTALPVARRCSSVSSAPSIQHTNPCLGDSLVLADGRTLGFHLYGDPKGIPILYIHGVADSGVTLEGKEDGLARAMGIRWIAPDRPGVGKSTLQPGRSILGYSEDIRQLIRHLGLEQYYMLGVSGGSAYTLACAKLLPREQVRGVGVCAGVAPWHAGRRGQPPKILFQMYMMKYWPTRLLRSTNDIYVPLARDVDPTAMANRFRQDLLPYMSPDEADAYMTTDPMQSAVRVFRQYYAQGINAHVDDMRILTRPWGFRIEDVGYEGVKLWYGGSDINTPPHMGLHLARRLPKSVYKEYEGETHSSLLGGGHLGDILGELVAG